MNEPSEDKNGFIKNEQSMILEQELDLQNCIEEFDRIYSIPPEEFASDFCDGDSNHHLSSEFTFNIGERDHGWVDVEWCVSENNSGASKVHFLIWTQFFHPSNSLRISSCVVSAVTLEISHRRF